MNLRLAGSRLRGAAARGAVAGVIVLGWAGTALAQSVTLEGVWGIVTQERNCTTNVTMGTPSRALITYHAGGAISESRYIPIFATGQLSEGHGTWRHEGGSTYSGRVVTLLTFETPPGTPPGSPGFQAGWQIATQTITMTGPDSFTMAGSSQFVNGNREVYRVGCATRTGERFK